MIINMGSEFWREFQQQITLVVQDAKEQKNTHQSFHWSSYLVIIIRCVPDSNPRPSIHPCIRENIRRSWWTRPVQQCVWMTHIGFRSRNAILARTSLHHHHHLRNNKRRRLCQTWRNVPWKIIVEIKTGRTNWPESSAASKKMGRTDKLLGNFWIHEERRML